MTQNTGTYDISALLAVKNQSVAQYGLSNIEPVLRADLAAHNANTLAMLSDLCEVTTDRQRRYGGATDGEMVEVDEFGRAPTQTTTSGDTVAFPLRLFQYNIGWTAKWFEMHTPEDMAMAQIAAEKAHLRAVLRDIKKAVFLSANYTWTDFLVDKVDLSVKRLINADGANIPGGPNGETFDGSTHTHYNANASLTAAAFLDNIRDVVEHGNGGVRVVINAADETAVSALTGFKALSDARFVYNATDVTKQTLDLSRLDNRMVGYFGAAEVWVRPWGIANYALAYDPSASQKPLAFRQRAQSTLQGLRMAAETPMHQLYARFMEDEFGVGVWNRTAAAVLYFAGASYTDPTIA